MTRIGETINQRYDSCFVKQVDELSLMCNEDPELKNGFALLDKEAYNLGISIYDIVNFILKN